MEVVRAAVKLGFGAQRRVAVTAAQKSHSYGQLLSSAWQLSNTLLAGQPLLAGGGEPAEDGRKERTSGSLAELVQKVNGITSLNGARIGIVAKPSSEFVAGMWATWISGAVVVPVALSYPEREILHVMNDAEVSMVMGTEEYQGFLEHIAHKCSAHFYLLPVVPSLPPDLKASKSFQSGDVKDEASGILFKEMLAGVEKSIEVDGDKPALIVYTSGTTGKPKGVVHTHHSLAAQVQILAEAWEYTPTDRFLHCLPLHHVHGLINALLAPLYAGAVVDFIPKFSVREVWHRWSESYHCDGSKAENAITVFTGVPTMYARLLKGYELMEAKSQKAAASAVRQLRLMMCGSSALPYPVMKQWESLTGHQLLERYGMTEFMMALSNALHGERRAGTVGKPLPNVQVKIVTENATNNNTSSVGELYVKSPSMFKEYWRQPQITKESFGDDGYFKTGDTATIDEDGFFVILGQLELKDQLKLRSCQICIGLCSFWIHAQCFLFYVKRAYDGTSVDILKVAGYKLSALEIEAALLEHPDIAECAVLGIPDTDYGEIICAITVPETKAQARAAANSEPVITIQDLQKWAKEKIALYKIPQRLHVWESLPRNAMGKVNKKELKQLLSIA